MNSSVIKEVSGKICITIGIVLLLLLIATITIDATDVKKPYIIYEPLTRYEINEHVSNGWDLHILLIHYLRVGMSVSGITNTLKFM